MKIENQVCTLEQAKKIKELGVSQLSLFYHTDDGRLKYGNIRVATFSAFTSSELGIMLGEDFNFSYHDSLITEADARARDLIIHIENNFLSLDEVNQRLTR